jgi:hypothetical protein
MSSCPLDGNAFLQFDKRGVLCSLQVTERRSGGRPLAVASRPFRAKGRSKEAAGGIATLSTGRIAATLEKAGILNARR